MATSKLSRPIYLKGGIYMTIKQAIKELNQCNGDCKHCEHWRMKTADLTDHITVYAHYCDIANKAGYIWYGERLATLKQETLLMLYLEIDDVP